MKKYFVNLGEKEFVVEINGSGESREITVDGKQYPAEFRNGRFKNSYQLLMDNRLKELEINSEEGEYQVKMDNIEHQVKCESERARFITQFKKSIGGTDKPMDIKAPMPGLILDIYMEVGSVVEKGGRVAIIEAMKMENEVKSPISGTVTKISAKAGQAVEKNSILAVVKPVEA